MKRLFIVWVAIVLVCGYFAINFSFPAKARGAEKEDWSKQAVFELCQANIRLAEQLEEILKQIDGIDPFYDYDVPKKSFFIMVADLAVRGGENVKYEELAYELADDNRLLRMALGRLGLMLAKQ